jgi:hypothetical protein
MAQHGISDAALICSTQTTGPHRISGAGHCSNLNEEEQVEFENQQLNR